MALPFAVVVGVEGDGLGPSSYISLLEPDGKPIPLQAVLASSNPPHFLTTKAGGNWTFITSSGGFFTQRCSR